MMVASTASASAVLARAPELRELVARGRGPSARGGPLDQVLECALLAGGVMGGLEALGELPQRIPRSLVLAKLDVGGVPALQRGRRQKASAQAERHGRAQEHLLDDSRR